MGLSYKDTTCTLSINKRLECCKKEKLPLKATSSAKGGSLIPTKETWLGMTWGWFKRGIWCFFNRAHARALEKGQ